MLPAEARLARGADRSAARPLIHARAVALALGALALGACGEEDSLGGSGAIGSELTITLDVGGAGPRPERVARVVCRPSEATRSCRALEGISAADLAPVPRDAICTQIYGGPDVVRIEGTLRGEAVDARLTRANGCEINRFESVEPLLRASFAGYRPGEAIGPQG